MLHTLITTLILTATLALAEPPNIATLSDLTIDQAFANEQSINNNYGLVILADEHPLYPESWERSVWNDETFAQQLKDRKIMVVYISRDSDPAIYSLLNPRSSPAVYFWNFGAIQSSRFGHSSSDTPEKLLEWTRLARQGSSFSKEIINQLKETPNDFKLRFELIKELYREKNYDTYFEQICWVFEHNEAWHQYEINHELFDPEQYSDPETHTRAAVIQYTNWFREQLKLNIHTKSKRSDADQIDGWDQAIKATDLRLLTTELDYARDTIVVLRRTLESKRDNNTATDRDLFILKALTAEGEEARALTEEYQPYFK